MCIVDLGPAVLPTPYSELLPRHFDEWAKRAATQATGESCRCTSGTCSHLSLRGVSTGTAVSRTWRHTQLPHERPCRAEHPQGACGSARRAGWGHL